ncbi:MAG: DNA polymerase-4 [Oceanicoccus sp.]|jgi:DNA polymerase-4
MIDSTAAIATHTRYRDTGLAASRADISARKIIHCDADCFYAAIEMRDDPSLRGRPIAVGGAADRRGVISTCNYEARAFGVHSAMATVTAKRLCRDLLVVPHHMERYKEAAMQIREIFYDYSELVEPLSLDEAFIDVSDSLACRGSATLIAEEIRQRVFEKVGITVSAGVAPNKFLAKVGSDWNKPNGICVITPAKVDSFVAQLPVSCLFGVGKVTAQKLLQIGVHSCGDLRQYDVYQLTERFGIFGKRLHELSYGIDERLVRTSRSRKSLSVEHTYATDLPSVQGCLGQLPALYEKLNHRLQQLYDSSSDGRYRVIKQFVKVKFSDFQSTTMECISQGSPRIAVFNQLCEQSLQRGEGMPVRLLGLGLRFQDLSMASAMQLSLFTE